MIKLFSPLPLWLLSLVLSVANGSGFMQWSRPMAGPIIGSVGSVAGINVLSYKVSNGTWQTDIVYSSTGDVLLGVSQNQPFDTSIVVTPAEDSLGYYTCQPLYTAAGEGSVATQPSWCGVLQLSSTNSSAGAHIMLPNASIVPLMPSALHGSTDVILPAWNCSDDMPCAVRSQELRTGQLGGCHRRINSSIAQIGPTDFGPVPNSPTQSTHVTIMWNGTLFMFRPLVVAAASSAPEAQSRIVRFTLNSSMKQQQQTASAVDHQLQYVSVSYALGPDRTPTDNGTYVYQCLVCALALINTNGTVNLYDSDRDDIAMAGTGLPFLTSISPSITNDEGQCIPSIESTQRLMPSFNQTDLLDRATNPGIYSTTLVLTCATTGTGYLFDVAIQGPGLYPAMSMLVGDFSIPPEFIIADLPPGLPLTTDTLMLLIQPRGQISEHYQVIANLLTSSYAYSVGIVVSRLPLNTNITIDALGQPGSAPNFAAMTFTSAIGNQTNASVILTKELVGMCTMRNFNTDFHGASIQNVTSAIGWVTAAAFPTYVAVESPDDAVLQGQLIEIITSIASWAASDGISYAMLTENLTVLVNVSGGVLTEPTAYTVDRLNVPHGGIWAAPQISVKPYSSVLRSESFPIWRVLQPAMAGLIALNPSLSSNRVVVTSSSDFESEGGHCVYALSTSNGVLASAVSIEYDPLVPPSVNWQQVDYEPLLSPYTLSYCDDLSQGGHAYGESVISVVPSVESLVLQLSSPNRSSAISIPLRDAIVATNGVSFGLNKPIDDDVVDGPTVAINPIGSDITFVCSQATLTAHAPVIGNIQWSLPLSTLPGCIGKGTWACRCPSDANLLTTSADKQFLICHVMVKSVQGYNGTVAGILAVMVMNGVVINFYSPDTYIANADSCTGSPPTKASIGPITEVIRMPPLPDLGKTLAWAGIATVPGTSCFAILSIFCSSVGQCSFSQVGKKGDRSRRKLFPPLETGILKSEATAHLANGTEQYRMSGAYGLDFSCDIGILEGVWANFTSAVQLTADSIILVSVTGSEDRSKLTTVGNNVYVFSLSTVFTNGADGNYFSFFSATFVINNVLDCAPVGALWFAVQLSFYRNQDPTVVTLGLSVFQFGPLQGQGSPLDSTNVYASFNVQDPALFSKLAKVSLFSLPRMRTPTVCIAASNISCYTATTDLTWEAVLLAQGDVEYYGKPIVSDTSLIIFAQDGTPCQALIYTELQYAPQVLWEQPTWVGIERGVDMGINSSSCTNALLTSEGLLLMCKPNEQAGSLPNGEPRRRLYLLEARTGRVLLANGPTAEPTSTTFSGSGSTLTYVSADVGSTAYSVQLTGASAVELVEMHSSFCLSGLSDSGKESNYYMTFDSDSQSIHAILTPWATNETVVDILITNDSSTIFPLSSNQFRGFLGIRLGNAFSLENSKDALGLLSGALPPQVQDESALSFVRGQPTTLSTSAYSTAIAYSDTCSTCSTCPFFCGLDIITGDQYLFTMLTNSEVYHVSRKKLNSTVWNNFISVTFPYSGNDSLAIARQEENVSGWLQPYTVGCVDGTQTTYPAQEGRYCTAVPGLNGKSYVDIEIAPDGSFASVSSYTVKWGEEFFTSRVSVMPHAVWLIGSVPTLVNIIQEAMNNDAFPTSLSNTGAFISVASVSIASFYQATIAVNQLEVIINTATGPTTVTLPAGPSCDSMDLEIAVCPSAFESTFDPDTKKSTKSVVWSSSSPSNWGEGFVSTDFEVAIPVILRAPINGTPVQCGGEQNTCLSRCHPVADCGSQLTAYFDSYLQTYSSQPLGSSVTMSMALAEACRSASISAGANLSSGITSTFYCTSDGNVTITARTIDNDLFVLGKFPSGVHDSFLGVTFTCSDCAYFMFNGIISQPVGWIAAGAVKSLVLTILFYFLLDRIRAHNRLQIRLRGRHRQLAKRLEALEDRLAEHENRGGSESGIAVTSESFTTVNATAVAKAATTGAVFTTSKPVPAMSDDERAAAHKAVAIEVARTRERVKACEAEVSTAESNRWACSRWLPNPITLYSSLVINLSGIRHPSERQALLVRVQDGLSSREVTEQQLVTTLMHITGELASGQHMVEAFSQYYQWHMCLNRQVVIRDHIDESAHAGAPVLGGMLDQALLKTHSSLRSVYREFCVAMRDRSSPTSALPIQEAPSAAREPASSPEEELLFKDSEPHPLYTPTEREPMVVANTAKRPIEELLRAEADSFVALIPSYPQCFEYVALPSRTVDDKLMPNTLLLLFSIGQFLVSIIVYSVNVTGRKVDSRSADARTSFDLYQSIFFMAFNSSTPSALLVSAISRADLGSLEQYQTWRTKLKDIFTDLYVWLVLVLFLPPLATHVVPGMVLYCWLLLPPLLASVWIEYYLRVRLTSQTKLSVAVRFLSRVLLLFVAAMVSTTSYNYSATFLYSSPEGYMRSGSYRKVGYLQTIIDDFDARSIGCLYQHITTSASNFLQAGFASLY